jgi:hypothetical protein
LEVFGFDRLCLALFGCGSLLARLFFLLKCRLVEAKLLEECLVLPRLS